MCILGSEPQTCKGGKVTACNCTQFYLSAQTLLELQLQERSVNPIKNSAVFRKDTGFFVSSLWCCAFSPPKYFEGFLQLICRSI